jgi:YgiT-type zinc finger domain-containing protein
MKCEICGESMIKKISNFDFFMYGQKITIKNYPFYVCPKCADIKIKKLDMKRTANFINTEKINSIKKNIFR